MERLAEIEARIREQTRGLRFGLNGDVEVDAKAWAEQAVWLGCSAAWAVRWINDGYPKPPGWMQSVPSKTETKAKPDRLIGNRFAVRDNEIVKLSNGEILPRDEPLFLVRARDSLALPCLRQYRNLATGAGCNQYLLDLLEEMIAAFERFQNKHPERMKLPGVTRGQ